MRLLAFRKRLIIIYMKGVFYEEKIFLILCLANSAHFRQSMIW